MHLKMTGKFQANFKKSTIYNNDNTSNIHRKKIRKHAIYKIKIRLERRNPLLNKPILLLARDIPNINIEKYIEQKMDKKMLKLIPMV